MVLQALSKIFGSRNERQLKRMGKVVQQISALEPEIETLSDDELYAQREKFRARLEQGEALEGVLPEAFATVREAGRRS
ncbi:MAG: hypothetical protein HOE54_01005, partial [Gammaproteobacteria bacterium]|nr:hypothetical protein [Gammaproteobacteria bacterium]